MLMCWSKLACQIVFEDTSIYELRDKMLKFNIQQPAEKEQINTSCVFLPKSFPKPTDLIPTNTKLQPVVRQCMASPKAPKNEAANM